MAGYTRDRKPVTVVFNQAFASREEAFQAERRIKGCSRAKKLALDGKDWEALKRLSTSHLSTGLG